MKRLFVLLFFLILLTNFVNAQDRYSKKVDNVFDGYSAQPIVSSDEEPIGDQKVSNAPECDIKSAISCYDDDYLRVDILLNNAISYKFKVWYAIKFIYIDGTEEWYTFYPTTEEFIYEVIKNGKVTITENLSGVSSGDSCGVTLEDYNVYLIINKDKHFGGEKGKTYFLQTQFMSGFIDDNNKMHVADETNEIKLHYKR